METIQLPAGLQDIVGDEADLKRKLQNRIEDIFKAAGCTLIQTPAIEYYQTYAKAFSNLKDAEMFKFFGQDGEILTLRMDMTVPIARAAAAKLLGASPVQRLYYTADVFKVRHLFGGRRSQVTDCGMEWIGLGSEADLEVLYTALKVMEAMEAQDWVLEIADARLFDVLSEEAGLTLEQRACLADLIDRKSMVELEAFLKEEDIANGDFFLALPLMAGPDALRTARQFEPSGAVLAILDELEALCQSMANLGYGDHISVDLGKIPHLNYYTGLIFEGFVGGTGYSVLSGGRYDRLLENFGKQAAAIGFSVKLDYVGTITPEEKPACVRIVTGLDRREEALRLADDIRKTKPCILEYGKAGQLEVME